MKHTNAKILLLDIETAPALVYTWGLFDQNIGLNQIVHDGYMLSWAAKWLGDARIMSDSVFNHTKSFKADPRDDKSIAFSIWKLMDEADIIVAHNGDQFDIKWLNTVFLKNGLPPISSYKSVDTLREAKNNFKFLSNKLEFLVKKLGVGEKMGNEGFTLWTRCMEGDKKAWDIMVKYNKQDVLVLEKLYLQLRPFIKRHPNLALYADGTNLICTSCGGSEVRKKGYAYTQNNKFQRFICLACGKNIRDGKGLLTKEERNNIPRNVV